MKRCSEKLTRYIIKAGVAPEEMAEVYQYGFQMALEMLVCFSACFILALWLHMILQFIVASCVFISLRTYAGGVHLNSFGSCFICSVVVQTAILIISDAFSYPISISWIVIGVSVIMIWKVAPVGNINREMSDDESIHCKKMTINILISIVFFSALCTIWQLNKAVSLIAMTVLIVLLSQYIGMIMYKIEKGNIERE